MQHMIMDNFTTKNAGGVTFTEPHGSTVADIDGDRIPDFIVGKKYWSHNDTTEIRILYGPPVLTSTAPFGIRKRQAAPSSCPSSCTTARA